MCLLNSAVSTAQVLVTINITKTIAGSKHLTWTFFEDVNPVIMPIAVVNRHASMT